MPQARPHLGMPAKTLCSRRCVAVLGREGSRPTGHSVVPVTTVPTTAFQQHCSGLEKKTTTEKQTKNPSVVKETFQRQVQPPGTKLPLTVNRNQLPKCYFGLWKFTLRTVLPPKGWPLKGLTLTQKGFLTRHKTTLRFHKCLNCPSTVPKMFFFTWPSNSQLRIRAHHTNLCPCSYFPSLSVFMFSASEDDLMALTSRFCQIHFLHTTQLQHTVTHFKQYQRQEIGKEDKVGCERSHHQLQLALIPAY